jgi:YVTN family beta-propeller protein
MKFILRLTLFFIAPLVFIQGCYRDEILTSQEPSNQSHKLGVYVLSEGTASPNSSQLSFLSYATGDFSLNITFPSYLGLYPDGLIDYNGSMYSTDKGSPGGQGKIYKLDSNGIISASNSIGVYPYSLAASNGKAYCTNGPDSSVSVVDLNSLIEIKRIKVGLNPQEIIALNNRVFAANTRITGGGIDSTVSVINVLNDQEIAKIKVNVAPSSLAITKDGFLLVGTSGSGGMIYKYNPDSFQKVDSFFVNSLTVGDINVDYNSNYVYFISNRSSIVRLNLLSKEIATIITSSSSNSIEYINGYAYDVKNQKHYIADARDFSRPGYLYKYNISGLLELGFQTGISPRRILIRN